MDRTNIIYQLNKSAVYFEFKQYSYVIQICANLFNRIEDKQLHLRIAKRLAYSYFEMKQYANAEKYFDIAIKESEGNVDELKMIYNESKELHEEEERSKLMKGPQMTQEIERLLMHDEVRYIIKMVNEDSNNIKKLRKDPKYRNYIEKMIQLGMLQSTT